MKLLVEMLESYEGRVFDPCCGSGGMFVQSKKFIKHHHSLLDQFGASSLNRAVHSISLNGRYFICIIAVEVKLYKPAKLGSVGRGSWFGDLAAWSPH